MSESFDRYLEDPARVHKKPASISQNEMMLDQYLRPFFGSSKVLDVTRADIVKWHRGMSHIPYRANRGIALLSKALNLAEAWGWRPVGSNPCRHVTKFKETQRRRYLSQQELARLGDALRMAEANELAKAVSVYAVAAIRLLVLTGARLELRWDHVNFDRACLELPDSKTGAKEVFLPPAAGGVAVDRCTAAGPV